MPINFRVGQIVTYKNCEVLIVFFYANKKIVIQFENKTQLDVEEKDISIRKNYEEI